MSSNRPPATSRAAMVDPKPIDGGDLSVPGDKSVSHRVAMLSALAGGESTIVGFLQAEDCLNTLKAVDALGARSYLDEDGTLKVRGTGGRFISPAGPLDMGNSGTGLRLLTGLVAGIPLEVELTGDKSLRSRPMGRIRDPLAAMGATIELSGEKGCAPIRVRGGGLKAIEYALPMASAQVKSCVLLAGLHAAGTTAVIEPGPTRDHTELALRTLGASIRVNGARIEVDGSGGKPLGLKGRAWTVPGDFSSAAFFFAAAAMTPGCRVTIRGVGLNPRRTALLAVLARMGATVEVEQSDSGDEAEPVGTVTVIGAGLKGTVVGGAEIPNLIDELPLVAVLGAVADGRTEIRGAAELRVKESDRIACMAENLRAFEAPVEERPDGLVVTGIERPAGGKTVRSFGDHRIAMAMAVLATRAAAPTTINNVGCVDTSYPGFWADFRRVGAYVE